VQTWGYCDECAEWFVCVRGIDGVVADWHCPVCGLRPVSIEQWDGAGSADDRAGLAGPAAFTLRY
jgi:hypothetical protein